MNKSIDSWESAYRQGGHNTLWPWSDLVSLVSRQVLPILTPKIFNVLELGCGPGSNIPFFLSLNVNYHAIDGSSTAINNVHRNFPNLSQNVVTGDFTSKNLFSNRNNFFDLIVFSLFWYNELNIGIVISVSWTNILSNPFLNLTNA